MSTTQTQKGWRAEREPEMREENMAKVCETQIFINSTGNKEIMLPTTRVRKWIKNYRTIIATLKDD